MKLETASQNAKQAELPYSQDKAESSKMHEVSDES